MVKYPEYAAELKRLLDEDQKEYKVFSAKYYWHAGPNKAEAEAQFRKRVRERTAHALAILGKIGEPSLENIGSDAAQALSILALHDSAISLQKVLAAFVKCYEHDAQNTYYQAIPSMTDFLRLLERRPQVFGTQWSFDEHKRPFLPTVENFEHVNERRAEYGLEPLHWPRSLAIPESEQSWLELPLSEAVMRDLTDEEFDRNYKNHLH